MFFLVLYMVKMKAVLSLAALLVVSRTSCRHILFEEEMLSCLTISVMYGWINSLVSVN